MEGHQIHNAKWSLYRGHWTGRPHKGKPAPTKEPSAPCPGVGMKAMRATMAVRTLQEGCQASGWWEDMDRQSLTPGSNLPWGVSIMNAGGCADKEEG
eukprot:1159115-Pelagomonas_calceolata.AAC.10